jgi:excisionase family DNA binding protein
MGSEREYPAPDDVEFGYIMDRLRGWKWVTPEQRAQLRVAVGVMPLVETPPPPKPVIDQPLRVAAVAAALNVSRQQVRRLIKSGELRGYTLSDKKGSEFRVNESALREYVARAWVEVAS